MKINSVILDQNDNRISVETLKTNALHEPRDTYRVVYAHANEVNGNGLLLLDNSIKTTRDKYPLLVEHSDKRVEDVVGYIETTGETNENGEFLGDITFYDTPQGTHAKQLWDDGVFNELSVSYFLEDYEYIEDGDYVRVNSAILKEVSIVSVGADRNTHQVDEPETVDEPDESTEQEVEDKGAENTLELDKLALYKQLLFDTL